MLTLMTALALLQAAPAAAPAAAAAVPPALQNLPGTKVQFYDVTGKNAAAIQKSIQRLVKEQPKVAGQLFAWDVGASLTKETVGTACTIKAAKANLEAVVNLPRLTEGEKLSAEDRKLWTAYEAGLQKNAADNIQFVVARLPAIEQSLVGKPCDQAQALWNSGIDALLTQQAAFRLQQQQKK